MVGLHSVRSLQHHQGAECLAKWQLLRTAELGRKMDRMIAAYEATLAIYKRASAAPGKGCSATWSEIDEVEEGDSLEV
mgnify:CR=1 FL=1